MAGIVVLLAVVTISIVATRVATVALTMTGLSRDLARFQARSAFSGVGFTTSEAEQMVDHPVRRRIVMILMLAGNAGLVTVVASIVFTVVRTDQWSSAILRASVLSTGLVALYLLTRSAHVEAALRRLIGKVLRRWTQLDVYDYEMLLDLTGDYKVTEIDVEEGEWVAERPIGDLDLPDEGVLVLAVRRADGTFLGAPGSEIVLEPGDTMIVYGHADASRDLGGRLGGAEGAEQHDHSKRRHDASQTEETRSDTGPRRPEE